MKKLVKLAPSDFDKKTYAALAWTRDYALFNGDFPDPKVVKDFEAEYTEQQQRDILAVLTVMGFANRWMNTTTGRVLNVGD